MNSFGTFHSKENKNDLKKKSFTFAKKFFSDQGFEETFSKIKLEIKNEDSYLDIMKKMISIDELSHQLHFDESEEELNKQEKEKLTLKQSVKKNNHNRFSKRNSKTIKIYKLPQLKIIQSESKKEDQVKSFPRVKLNIIPEFVKEKKSIFKPEQSTRKSLNIIKNESYFQFDTYKFNKSKNNPLLLSQNSFGNVLSTNLNTVAGSNSVFSFSEKREREKLMTEDLSEKYAFNEFPNSIKENLKKFDSKLKESKKKIHKIINQYKLQEKTFNKSLEISNTNLVFIYDINSRIDIEKDDISKMLKKRGDSQVTNLNYFNAHRYGNIIKEKYNMNNLKNSEELSRLIQIEKHKQVEEMLDKVEMKKKILIKRIKIKNL